MRRRNSLAGQYALQLVHHVSCAHVPAPWYPADPDVCDIHKHHHAHPVLMLPQPLPVTSWLSAAAPGYAESLDAKHAGVGVSIFNAVGAAIGGFLGPFVVGAFVQRTGTFVSSMVAMGAFLCWAGVMMVGLGIYTRISKRRASRRRQEPSDNRIDSDVVASTSELLAARKVIASDIDNDNRALSDVELAVRPNPRPQSVFEA